MKEDILEQLVDDYLQTQGYFTRHNIKFRPRREHSEFDSKKDSNHSDIDVIGIHPQKTGCERVIVVSCKSWQVGFNVSAKLSEIANNKIVSGREAWQGFRELVKPKWSEAFIHAVKDATGSDEFTYMLAVTVVIGDRTLWQDHPPFREALRNNPIRMVELTEMLDHIQNASSTTVAASNIGRILQLMRAAQRGRKALINAVEEDNET